MCHNPRAHVPQPRRSCSHPPRPHARTPKITRHNPEPTCHILKIMPQPRAHAPTTPELMCHNRRRITYTTPESTAANPEDHAPQPPSPRARTPEPTRHHPEPRRHHPLSPGASSLSPRTRTPRALEPMLGTEKTLQRGGRALQPETTWSGNKDCTAKKTTGGRDQDGGIGGC